jgi:glycosyltransferase involved in cell wall biosynthesis
MLLPETLKLHDHEKFEWHYIYFLPWKDQMVESIRSNGGKVTCFSAGNNLTIMLQAKAIALYAREHNICIIHSHLPWAGLVSRIVAYLAAIPVVYTEHNKQERYHWITRVMNLTTMNYLTRIVAVSGDVAESIRKHKPTLNIPLQVVLNGVNTETFQRDAESGNRIRTALGIPLKAPVIGTVAVFRFQKRLDLWMEQAAMIIKHRPDAHFILVGDGPLKLKLEEKRKTLGLEGRIHMPGLQTEVRPYYSAFDIYMMSSEFEGLPIALLEAMSMRCAVVATDAGGIKEVIRPKVDGVTVNVNRVAELGTSAVRLLADPQLLTLLADAGRERVVNHFSLKAMVHTLEEMYTTMNDASVTVKSIKK